MSVFILYSSNTKSSENNGLWSRQTSCIQRRRISRSWWQGEKSYQISLTIMLIAAYLSFKYSDNHFNRVTQMSIYQLLLPLFWQASLETCQTLTWRTSVTFSSLFAFFQETNTNLLLVFFYRCPSSGLLWNPFSTESSHIKQMCGPTE